MKIWIEIMWNPANERFSCHHSFPNKVKVICITVFLKSYFQNGVNFQFFKKTGVKLGSFSKSSVGFNFRFPSLNLDKQSILTLFCTVVFVDLKNINLSPKYNFSNTGQFMMPTRYNIIFFHSIIIGSKKSLLRYHVDFNRYL